MRSPLFGLRLYQYPLYIGDLKKGGKRSGDPIEEAELFQCAEKALKDGPQQPRLLLESLHNKNATGGIPLGDYNSSKEAVEQTGDTTVESKGFIQRMKEKISEIPFLNQHSHLTLVEPDSHDCFRAFTISTMPLFQKSFHCLEDIWRMQENVDKSAELNRDRLTKIDQRLHELKDLLVVQHDNLSKLSRDPIEDLQYEHRGLLLIVTHYLYECRDCLSGKKHHLWFLHRTKETVENLDKRGDAILALLELGVALEERRIQKKQTSPFLDEFNIEEFEHYHNMDITGVLLEMGKHYVPQLARFFALMVRVTASKNVSDTYSDYNKMVRSAIFASANVFYTLFKEDAAKGCADFFKSADVYRAQRLWNLPEGKLLQRLLFTSLPAMKVAHGFTIESSIQRKRDSVHQLLAPVTPGNEHREASSHEEAQEVRNTSAGKSESELQKIVAEKSADGQITLKDFEAFSQQLYYLLPEHYNHPRIQLQLISDERFKGWNGIEMKSSHPFIHSFKNLANGDLSKASDKLFADSPVPCVILFIHGGGFISLSSSSHNTYLFKWAKELKIPIIAVDYVNAPQETFPTQIEECVAVYQYIAQNSELMFGTKVRVILAGDSAGGNMIMATTLKCIESGGPVPDGIVGIYPAAYVAESPSPARLLALIDPLVNLSFLKLCGTAYPHPESCSKSNPFLSPVVAPDEILKQFPPCFLSVGSLDPLFDDAVWMAKRLNKVTGKVCLNLLDGLGHGYCNLITVIPEAREANRHVTAWVSQLLKEFKKEDEMKMRCKAQHKRHTTDSTKAQ